MKERGTKSWWRKRREERVDIGKLSTIEKRGEHRVDGSLRAERSDRLAHTAEVSLCAAVNCFSEYLSLNIGYRK